MRVAPRVEGVVVACDTPEGSTQHLSREGSFGDVTTSHVEVRRWRRVAGDFGGVVEVMLVMGARATADRDGYRQRVPPSTGSAHTLLVVEALWWHVRQGDRVEASDIDACLHGGRYAQEVQFVGFRDLLAGDENALEPCLALRRHDGIGLASELRAVQ